MFPPTGKVKLVTVKAGDRFGRLLVLAFAGRRRYSTRTRPVWLCRCSCGVEKVILEGSLLNGKTVSCGCFNRERFVNAVTKHGHARGNKTTPEYRAWMAMKARCYDENSREYENYGSRGILVSKRWYHSFSEFLKDMGPRPSPRHSLDRINNNKGYNAKNCKWSTRREQMNNRRMTSKVGNTPLADLAKKYDIPINTLRWRLRNWDLDEALNRPVRYKRQRR